MTSETTLSTRRHTLLATFAAVAFLGAFGVAQAQSSQQGTSTTQVNPSATDTNREASQGMQPSQRDTRTDTMRSDRSTSGATMGDRTRSGTSSSTTAQSGTTGSPTQVNPDSRDSNRQASQGMVPSTDDDTSAQARINAPGSDLRNDRTMRDDRTTMARAPRADRN